MKKRFGFMLIFLLTYAFMSCPALVNRAFASGESSSPLKNPAVQQVIRILAQMSGNGDALADVQSSLPTSIQDLLDLITNSDIAKQIKAARDKRVKVREDRVQKLKDLFGGGD